jgi:hypothetical protein
LSRSANPTDGTYTRGDSDVLLVGAYDSTSKTWLGNIRIDLDPINAVKQANGSYKVGWQYSVGGSTAWRQATIGRAVNKFIKF